MSETLTKYFGFARKKISWPKKSLTLLSLVSYESLIPKGEEVIEVTKKTLGPMARFVNNVMSEQDGGKGWTNEQMADFIGGIDPSAVSHWRTGRAMPKDEHLMKLAGLAGVNAEDLIRLKQATALARRGVQLPTASGDMLSPDEAEFIRRFRRKQYQEIISDLVERLTRKDAA